MNISYKQIESLLQTYSLNDLLELNELTEADALLFLVDEGFVTLPEILPVDLDEE